MRKTIAYVLFLTALMIGLIYFLSSDFMTQKRGELVSDEEIDPTKSATEQEVVTRPDLEDYPKTKEVAIELEGQQETVAHERITDEGHTFVLYMDSDRFTFEQGLTQQITAKEQPLATLTIEYIPDQTTEQVADTRLQQLSEDFDLRGPEHVSRPLESVSYSGSSGAERVASYLLEDPMNSGIFILTARYPLESAEGFGARIDAMISTFEMVDLRKTQ